jgi:hypothetical protein
MIDRPRAAGRAQRPDPLHRRPLSAIGEAHLARALLPAKELERLPHPRNDAVARHEIDRPERKGALEVQEPLARRGREEPRAQRATGRERAPSSETPLASIVSSPGTRVVFGLPLANLTVRAEPAR